jgi:hypothetical protein
MKYLKFLYIILLLTYTLKARGQNENDCTFIIEGIKSNVFIEHFNICEEKSKNLKMLDSINNLNCDTFKICDRSVIFDNNIPLGLSPNKLNGEETKNMILFEYKIKRKNIVEILFWEPYTNANLILIVKKRRNLFKIECLLKGVY